MVKPTRHRDTHSRQPRGSISGNMSCVTRSRMGRPHYLLTPDSWPVVLVFFLLSIVVLVAGEVWNTSALVVLGWMLIGFWVAGVMARALAIETLAARAEGHSYRDGFWRFVRLIVVGALTGLIP